jgi:hypothetical protein
MLAQRVADRTFLYMLFCYVLEMREVRNKLECTSFEDYKMRLPGQRRLEFLNTVVFILLSLPIVILGFFDIETDPA